MKKRKLLGWAFIALASITSCTNNTEEILTQECEIRLTSEITPSRASQDLQSTQIVEGQQVGVTIIGGKSEHKNVAWSAGTDGALINTGDAVYWGNDVATITAYHPFSSSLKTDGTISFYRKADQNADEDYLASDLLWASTTASKTTNAVPLNFTHKLAKINVTLTSDEIEDLSGASIYICATKNSVNFNTTTGELTSLSSAEYNDVKAGTTTSTNTTASAIVIPRTLPANTGFIKVVKGGKTFTYNLTKEIKLESGKSYSYTVNLKEKQIQMAIVSSSITSWDNNDLGEVDADESFEMTAVDLGLSVKWGSCSLGASQLYGMGDFYAWGEVTPKNNYSKETYNYWDATASNYVNIGTEISGTQYDPATALLGEGWRLPTKEECEELISNCDSWANNTDNKPYHFVMKSKKNEKSIYFGGYRYAAATIGGSDYTAYFMSGSLSNGRVHCVEITADYHQSVTLDREYGYEIRPVYDGD